MQNKIPNSFYSQSELSAIGLKHYGDNVMISRKASFYSAHKISVGSNVRIDDFCLLSGNITIGDHVHLNPFCLLSGGNIGITLEDFCNFSSRVTIYAVSDDYSGEWMTSPLLPERFTKITHAPVLIKRHAIIGTGSSIMAGVTVGQGCAIGAMTLVRKDLADWGIYAGVPARYIKARKKDLLELEKMFLSSDLIPGEQI